MVGISLVVAFSALGGSVLGSIRSYLEGSLGSDYVRSAREPELRRHLLTGPSAEGRRASRASRARTSLASTFLREGEEVSIVFGVDESYADIFRVNYAAGGPDAFSEITDGGALVGQAASRDAQARLGRYGEASHRPRVPKRYPVEGILENDVVGGGAGIYLSRETLASDFGEKKGEFLAIKAEPGTDRGSLDPGDRGHPARLPAVLALLQRGVEGADRERLQPSIRLLLRHHGCLRQPSPPSGWSTRSP